MQVISPQLNNPTNSISPSPSAAPILVQPQQRNTPVHAERCYNEMKGFLSRKFAKASPKQISHAAAAGLTHAMQILTPGNSSRVSRELDIVNGQIFATADRSTATNSRSRDEVQGESFASDLVTSFRTSDPYGPFARRR
jgi:hypothetical protein